MKAKNMKKACLYINLYSKVKPLFDSDLKKEQCKPNYHILICSSEFRNEMLIENNVIDNRHLLCVHTLNEAQICNTFINLFDLLLKYSCYSTKCACFIDSIGAILFWKETELHFKLRRSVTDYLQEQHIAKTLFNAKQMSISNSQSV